MQGMYCIPCGFSYLCHVFSSEKIAQEVCFRGRTSRAL